MHYSGPPARTRSDLTEPDPNESEKLRIGLDVANRLTRSYIRLLIDPIDLI